jgi:hypothetical protein
VAHKVLTPLLPPQIAPLAVGWAKLQEIRRHLDLFNASGKFSIAYMKQGGEKEFYLASACKVQQGQCANAAYVCLLLYLLLRCILGLERRAAVLADTP